VNQPEVECVPVFVGERMGELEGWTRIGLLAVPDGIGNDVLKEGNWEEEQQQ
jgi:hypothetical protein